ncbi:MAG: hypothetical protein A2Y48_00760 [Nitrospirae bacterium RIFCSPLOW2_12_42_9]|nr:MAG: hypothetical protein A2035_01460 [Nitrospirae bacterium GWA2_42_11]OGW54949.1 MAG: hypothetical protein A2Z60_00880 [Nitrospirae bacterium RIFCSPLOWO2_02_42_7]OGW58875.1 MAG: hypothetical protein A3D21_08700 [Nitrospirae bacterium RIFCSPHIGHO2_02_FULL_42_12]OGW62392.1 MAG: hypothetical protein A2Y48_00760 [Nitrospirae bacterium RIFCSPLOW2_12_42_9]HAS16661.1 hypothetical protein [Nitrospiraceae bacterium]
MDRQIKIRITKDGKVEVDSSVFKDCMDIAEQLKKLLGKIEKVDVKDESELISEERLKIGRD